MAGCAREASQGLDDELRFAAEHVDEADAALGARVLGSGVEGQAEQEVERTESGIGDARDDDLLPGAAPRQAPLQRHRCLGIAA